ncbi:BnaC07g17050D [Brassica napus]|uniref:BnaC07g17050D protein n=1 Tax=Brassica napus TaxID=3708 RepID=A0A078IEM7_BRANA|nr:BnaC07g17050D [Brassica napus]
MPATVNASCAPTFQPHLTAGAMYSIAGFDVARCNPNFRLSGSSLLVQFSDAISLNEFTEPISPIPEECFRFRSQGELFGLANTNTQLPETSLGRSPRKTVSLWESRFSSLMKRCSSMYKITDHPFPILIANTNLELSDVVGQIRYVQGSDLSKETTRVVICLLIDLELFTPNIFILYTNHKLRLSNIKFYKKFNSKHCFNWFLDDDIILSFWIF